MQKLLDKSRKTLSQHHSPGRYSDSGHFGRHLTETRTLPACFKHVHPYLLQHSERIWSIGHTGVQPSTSSSSSLNLILDRGPDNHPGPSSGVTLPPAETWLPDIYKFSSLGLNLEDRYSFASAQPTPFIPSSPRVSENKDFNFDHGDITVELVEETSYMAWF